MSPRFGDFLGLGSQEITIIIGGALLMVVGLGAVIYLTRRGEEDDRGS